MKRFLVPFLVLGFAVVLSTPAQAGALNLLTLDGNPDVLEDNDWDQVVDRTSIGLSEVSGVTDTANQINVGDFLFGMYEIDNVNGVSATNATGKFEGVFATKVLTSNAGGTFSGGFTQTLGPLAVGEYTALQGQYPNLPSRNSPESMILVSDDQSAPVGVNEAALPGNVNDALTEATDGTLIAEFGFRDGDEVWRADVNSLDPSTLTTLAFASALNVTFNSTSIDFLDVPSTTAGGLTNPNQGLPPAELHINPGSLDSTLPKGPFDIATDSNLQVNPVPEPGSLTLLGLGLTGVGAVGYRRRRRKIGQSV